MPEKVIELSVEETNRLRLSLGLPPLRSNDSSSSRNSILSSSSCSNNYNQATATAAVTGAASVSGEAVLSLSVSETNALREAIGLKPLNESGNSSSNNIGTKTASEIHSQAIDKEAEERIDKAKTARLVNQGIADFAKNYSQNDVAAHGKDDVLSWAKSMQSKPIQHQADNIKVSSSKGKSNNTATAYPEHDIAGMRVAHAPSELEEGSTTVMTLADAFILQTDDVSNKILGINQDDQALENTDLVDQRKLCDGLKAKRKLELGMGRAGGYAGFDDDEFQELGGAQAPARHARDNYGDAAIGKTNKPGGFQIGAMLVAAQEENERNASARHHAPTSLDTQTDMIASDFMTVEEEELERASRKSTKLQKFKKHKERHTKKNKKRSNKRRDDSDDEGDNPLPNISSSKSLLDALEETSADLLPESKRRRLSEGEELPEASSRNVNFSVNGRARFDTIMAKANDRTKTAFARKPQQLLADGSNEEPDDEFLNAALAKARRLNRLKEMTGHTRGADAVVASLQASNSVANATNPSEVMSSGAISFSIDETREFSRALQARAEQTNRHQSRSLIADGGNISAPLTENDDAAALTHSLQDDDVDMAELAKEMGDDVCDDAGDIGLDGGTVSFGRGLGGVLDLLKQTGDLTRPNANREELRGRAKDKKTYEDYESLDLSQVVRIGDNATKRDRELAKREIKLEYRDKNGRLLTRKEAFRELCYQFHGHGSGKRKEEKRNAQIAREQAEARVASNHSSNGVFGALKAAQKATGKAFVIHKT
ncbi:hypothetical protein MPSEU_000578800 [Mayamaea pseudoterrestris]|nr:hypothetical protein MPSEU_000578800 [Mayamaea pseudoterrestris]